MTKNIEGNSSDLYAIFLRYGEIFWDFVLLNPVNRKFIPRCRLYNFAILILSLIFLGAVSPSNAQVDAEQTVLSEDGTIEVGLTPEPSPPQPGEPTKLRIDFINKESKEIQKHIDYRVSVAKDGNNVFSTNLTHTATGTVKVPVTFDDSAVYELTVFVEGILFMPMPAEPAVFTLAVGDAEQPAAESPPTEPAAMEGAAEDAPSSEDATSQVPAVNKAVAEGVGDAISEHLDRVKEGGADAEAGGPDVGEAPEAIVVETVEETNVAPDSGTESAIPEWIKKNAAWWGEGEISDEEFAAGIQFMIKQGIINVSAENAGESGSTEIPDWVRENVVWWSQGLISDQDFIRGLEFMVKNGIISVE